MTLFADPYWFFALLPALLILWGLQVWGESRRRSLLRAFGNIALLERLVPARQNAWRRRRALLRIGAFLFLLIALAGPQWGIELVPVEDKVRQILIAVDTSTSMSVEDVSPRRIDRAKQLVQLLISRLKGNRAGILAFAGTVHVQCPLTIDLDAAKMFLRHVEVGMIPDPGTALGDTIRLSTKLLRKYPGDKALILITDGEDHRSKPREAAAAAAAEGIRILTLGVGTPEGGPIPEYDEQGKRIGYKKDRSGQTVVSRLKEKTLQALSEETGGAYARAASVESTVEGMIRWIERLDASDWKGKSRTRYKNRFQIPLWIALLLLLLEALTGAAFAKSRQATALLLLALGTSTLAPSKARAGSGDLKRGNAAYAQEDYEQALDWYSKAAQDSPKDPKARYNQGNALFRLGDYENAQKAFGNAAVLGKKKKRARAFYNLGTAHAAKKEWNQALGAYLQALKLDPEDPDIRYNFLVAARESKKKQQKGKDKKPKGKSKPKPSQSPNAPSDPGKSKPRKQKGGMSQEDAKRLLEALKDRERENLKKHRDKRLERSKGKKKKRRPGEADW